MFQVEECVKILEEYEEKVAKGGISNEVFQQTKKTVENCWKEAAYSFEDVARLMVIKEFILTADMKMVASFFAKAKIIMTPKDKKRGKLAVYHRLKKKFYLPSVRTEIDKMASILVQNAVGKLTANPTIDTIHELVEMHEYDLTYWMIVCYMKNIQLQKIIEKEYPFDTTSFYTNLYLFYVKEEFVTVMERPQELDRKKKEQHDLLKQENKKLKKEISKTTKKKFSLQTSVNELQKQTTKLNRDLEDLYENALIEIEQLKKEKEHAEQEMEKERLMYYSALESLVKQLNTEVPERMDDKIDLRKQKICVIGGMKERFYEEAVSAYNGQLRYLSSKELTQVEGAVSECDAVFFITEKVGHSHFYKSYEKTKLLGKPFIFVNSLGVTSFKRELTRYAQTL